MYKGFICPLPHLPLKPEHRFVSCTVSLGYVKLWCGAMRYTVGFTDTPQLPTYPRLSGLPPSTAPCISLLQLLCALKAKPDHTPPRLLKWTLCKNTA